MISHVSGPSLSGRRVAWLERRKSERSPDTLLRRVSYVAVETNDDARAMVLAVWGGLMRCCGGGDASVGEEAADDQV